MALLERQNVELIHEITRLHQVRAGLERNSREQLERAKSEQAVQISEIVKSVRSQQHLANIRRREMGELTAQAEIILGEEQREQRTLRARLHHLHVSLSVGLCEQRLPSGPFTLVL